jgi:hypothetical protein
LGEGLGCWIFFFFFVGNEDVFLGFCETGFDSFLIWIVTHLPALISAGEVAFDWKKNNFVREVFCVFVKMDFFFFFYIFEDIYLCVCQKVFFVFFFIWIMNSHARTCVICAEEVIFGWKTVNSGKGFFFVFVKLFWKD